MRTSAGRRPCQARRGCSLRHLWGSPPRAPGVEPAARLAQGLKKDIPCCCAPAPASPLDRPNAVRRARHRSSCWPAQCRATRRIHARPSYLVGRVRPAQATEFARPGVGGLASALVLVTVPTHGATTVGFAFTKLLGFKLLPRLKNIGAIDLYSPDAVQTAWPKWTRSSRSGRSTGTSSPATTTSQLLGM
ncbi:Tn3 family transposase [[Actinomadura] parvosata]|uniref:Tn3 family transposase n=1 Tax=[Actinomadura] parvosata TaxID=1955412 RepID=UPI00406C32BE